MKDNQAEANRANHQELLFKLTTHLSGALHLFYYDLDLAGKREITLKQNRSEGPIFMRCA